MSVLGHHTVAELADWLRAVDYQVSQTSKAIGEYAATWLAKDPATFHAWDTEWKAFQARYSAARAKADSVLHHASFLPVPDAAYPAEDEWQAIHLALAQTPGTVARGDLQEPLQPAYRRGEADRLLQDAAAAYRHGPRPRRLQGR